MGKECCCDSNNTVLEQKRDKIEKVSTDLNLSDIIGGWKARWNIGRMKYIVKPGLYMVGDPDENSEVFVTANTPENMPPIRPL